MKRLIVAIVILAAILAGGIAESVHIDRTFGELESAVLTAVAQFARTPGAKRETLPTEIRKRIREVFSKSSRNYPTIIPLITYI